MSTYATLSTFNIPLSRIFSTTFAYYFRFYIVLFTQNGKTLLLENSETLCMHNNFDFPLDLPHQLSFGEARIIGHVQPCKCDTSAFTVIAGSQSYSTVSGPCILFLLR